MDPETYDDDVYRIELLQKMRAIETIVYQAVFAPVKISIAGPVLVAATSSGFIHVYLLGPLMTPVYWDQVRLGERTAFPGPNLSFQAHPTQIYSLCFAGDELNPILVSGGDQDFRVWEWRDILMAMESPLKTKNLKPLHIGLLKRRTLGFREIMLPAPEVNDVTVNRNTGHLFLAGGDGLAHEWDVNTQQFTRQFEGHEDYLHAARYLQRPQELLTGSDDGTLGIWDVRQEKKVDFLRPQPAKQLSPLSLAPLASLWIGAISHDKSEMWIACGGGTKRSSVGRSHRMSATGGFLSMWHLPSRVPVHYTEISCDVHDVIFHDLELLSVGNDASLKKWSRSSGQLLAASRTTLPSSQFCVVDEVTDVIAVGGAAAAIDLYTMTGVVNFSLAVVDESSIASQ